MDTSQSDERMDFDLSKLSIQHVALIGKLKLYSPHLLSTLSLEEFSFLKLPLFKELCAPSSNKLVTDTSSFSSDLSDVGKGLMPVLPLLGE